MADLTLNEPIVLELQSRLESDLPAQVTTINARAQTVSDGFTLSNPNQVLDFMPVEAELFFPTIAIGDGPSEFEDDQAWSATGVHEILICAYEQDADQRALAWKLRRWEQAIASVALDTRKLGDAAWGVRLKRIQPGPSPIADDPDSPRTWMCWTGVVIVAKKDEE